ncbi:hypothetical protein BpHYR1_023873 [Brachionus plicatilis]|uniref:Uncharacterized protein n=1 Tax=Brachionus plicatilis TaxID=10195 RepID=A0A3M7QND8_BRAPC|nr:hypothetical protein BpHYR1_023873 [Brachionus plicatilis]
MFTGGLMTEEMGLEEINNETFINHFLYILFIFMMVILFLNVFTGISIDAVSELIKNSVADGVSNKIEYVDKIEEIMTNNNNKFLFLVRKFFFSFDSLIRKIYLCTDSKSNGEKEEKFTKKKNVIVDFYSRTANFFQECLQNFRNIKYDSNNLMEKVEIVSKRNYYYYYK